jgi:hypothetical protein
MRSTLLLSGALLLAGAGTAHAQAIYKCVAKGRPVSFQTMPCPPDATIAKIREYTPEAEPTPEQRRRQAAAWARRDAAPVVHSRTTTVVQNNTPDTSSRCAMARSERDAWERRTGLKRTYDQMRSWNNYVARACN